MREILNYGKKCWTKKDLSRKNMLIIPVEIYILIFIKIPLEILNMEDLILTIELFNKSEAISWQKLNKMAFIKPITLKMELIISLIPLIV